MIKILMNLILKNMFYLKNNLFNLLIILLSITHFTNAQSAIIQFHFTDGTQQNITLNEMQKIDFTPSELRLHQIDETIISWNFDLIDFYRYSDLETNIYKTESLPTEIQLNVFPNPASGVLNVNYQFPVHDSRIITIFSLNGKQVFEQRLQNTKEGIWQHDISSLPIGSYLIVIQSNNFSISKTILKK
jgi:hypothetical protein